MTKSLLFAHKMAFGTILNGCPMSLVSEGTQIGGGASSNGSIHAGGFGTSI
jgi:predicted NBD/HSP70 family sugar kinase